MHTFHTHAHISHIPTHFTHTHTSHTHPHISHTQLEIVHLVPTMLYFGYTLVMVFGFWLLTGTIGFYTTYTFICRIYGAVKQD